MDNNTNPIPEQSWTPNGNGNGSGTGLMDKAREQTTQAVHQAQQKAGEAVGQAREQVKSQLSEQKEKATEGIHTVAEVLRQTGRSLRDQNYDSAGQYAETAADQVDQFSEYLRDKDMDQLMNQVQDFARSRPALILGATFALGFLAARLIKNADTGGGASASPDRPFSESTHFSDPAYSGSNFG